MTNQDDPILAEFVAIEGPQDDYMPIDQGYWLIKLEGYRLGRAHQSEPVVLAYRVIGEGGLPYTDWIDGDTDNAPAFPNSWIQRAYAADSCRPKPVSEHHPLGPATPEDQKVYDSIAANYAKGSAPVEDDRRLAAKLAQELESWGDLGIIAYTAQVIAACRARMVPEGWQPKVEQNVAWKVGDYAFTNYGKAVSFSQTNMLPIVSLYAAPQPKGD